MTDSIIIRGAREHNLKNINLELPRDRLVVLTGSDAEVIDRIGQYVAAGAEQINLALRAPFDRDALERFSGTLDLT